MPLPRSVSWLFLLAVPGAAGWFSGKWLLEFSPSSRLSAHRTAPEPAAGRRPAVDPASPEGKWMSRVRSAGLSEYPALFDELDALFPRDEDRDARDAAQKWILSLWITRDLDAAAACIAAKKDHLLGCTFGLVLGAAAPDKVAAVLRGPLRETLGPYFCTGALHALAESDPRELLKLDDEAAFGEGFDQRYRKALTTLAASDPPAAAALWLSRGLKAAGGREALISIMGAWFARDPRGARQWADSLEDPALRLSAQRDWLGALAKADPVAARRELDTITPGEGLFHAYNKSGSLILTDKDAPVIVIRALAKEDLPGALTAMDELLARLQPPKNDGRGSGNAAVDPFGEFEDDIPDDNKSLFLSAIADAVLPRLPGDPAALIEELRKLPASQSRNILMDRLLFGKMAGQDAAATLEAARLVIANRDRFGQYSFDLLLQQAAAENPRLAASFAATLSGIDQEVAARAIIQILPRGNPELTAAIASAVPSSGWSETFVTELADRCPAQGAALIASQAEGPNSGSNRSGFAAAWVRTDPAATVQWALSLPADSAPDAVRGTARGWAGYDESAATAWVAGLPEGTSLREKATAGLASGLAAPDPGAAWQWASALSDHGLAFAAFTDIARSWGTEAPPEFYTAYEVVLDRMPFTPEEKKVALQLLTAPPLPHR